MNDNPVSSMKKLTKDDIDGHVFMPVDGGHPQLVGYVIGNTVYRPVDGGPPEPIGFVNGEKAFQDVDGGSPVYIGNVILKEK